MKTYDILNKISKDKPVCLIGHIEPDADALASMAVLKEFLQNHFKIQRVDIFAECNKPPKNCLEILEGLHLNEAETNYHTAIILDSPNIERIGIYKKLIDCAQQTIVIDHHKTNNNFGDINIVEMCSSTCEIVYSILKHFNYKISADIQGKIYAGMITDTNNFTVGNISKRTFEISGECVDNINRDEIYRHFLLNNTKKQMQVLSIAINNMTTYENDQIIISHITKDESQQLNTSFEDFSSIINTLATISGSKLVCFIQPKGNELYVSMRAQLGYDVATIAKLNGGGGHVGAAAFLSNKSITEVKTEILTIFSNQLKLNKLPSHKLF